MHEDIRLRCRSLVSLLLLLLVSFARSLRSLAQYGFVVVAARSRRSLALCGLVVVAAARSCRSLASLARTVSFPVFS